MITGQSPARVAVFLSAISASNYRYKPLNVGSTWTCSSRKTDQIHLWHQQPKFQQSHDCEEKSKLVNFQRSHFHLYVHCVFMEGIQGHAMVTFCGHTWWVVERKSVVKWKLFVLPLNWQHLAAKIWWKSELMFLTLEPTRNVTGTAAEIWRFSSNEAAFTSTYVSKPDSYAFPRLPLVLLNTWNKLWRIQTCACVTAQSWLPRLFNRTVEMKWSRLILSRIPTI